MQRHCDVIVAISLYAYLFPLCAAGRLSTYPGSTTVEHITDCLWRSISSGIVICPPSGSCLPLATGHLLSAIDHSPFAIRHSPKLLCLKPRYLDGFILLQRHAFAALASPVLLTLWTFLPGENSTNVIPG